MNRRNLLYLMCTFVSLLTFNKIDKYILFMGLLYVIYKLVNKKAEKIC